MRRHASVPDTDQPRHSLTEQIERLQEQYRLLGEQAARELEGIKSQVQAEQEEEKRALMEQIDLLRTTIYRLETEKVQTEEQFLNFKTLVEERSKSLHEHIRSFSLEALNNLEVILDAVEAAPGTVSTSREELMAIVPPPPAPIRHKAVPAASEPMFTAKQSDELFTEVPKSKKQKKERAQNSRRPLKKLVLYPTLTCVIGFGGYKGVGIVGPMFQEKGQVAGVSTPAQPTPSKPAPGEVQNSYPESFADLPYEQTTWDTVNDTEFGITFQYPKNTSNRVKLIGGNNLWVLRKNSYLIKVSRIETESKLDDWWENNKSEYEDNLGSTGVRDAFKGQPAWKLPSGDPAGTTYFVKHKEAVLQIWVLGAPDSQEDAKRIEYILNSFQFLKK